MSKRTQSESRAATRRAQLADRKDTKAKEKIKTERSSTLGAQRANAAAARKKGFEAGGSWAGFYLKMRGFLQDDDMLGQIGKYYKKYEKLVKNKKTIEYDRNSHTVAVNFKDIIKAGKNSLKGEVKNKVAENISNESKDNEGAKRLSGSEHVLNWLETEEWVREFLEQYEQVIVSGNVMFPGLLNVAAGGFSSSYFQFRKPKGGPRKKFSVKGDNVAALINYGLNEAVAAYLATTIEANKFSPNGDLLQKVGAGIQLWWLGRQMDKSKAPIFVFPPALSTYGDSTFISFCVAPGIFPTQPLFPIGNVDSWLTNFIINANFHLLSVAGLHFTRHKTSVTGIPIPFWVTPWIGYFTKPFAIPPLNPLSDLPWKLSPKEIIEELLPMAANYAVGQGVDLAGQVAAKVAAPVVAGVVSTFADSAPTPYGNDSAPTTTPAGTPLTQPGIIGVGN